MKRHLQLGLAAIGLLAIGCGGGGSSTPEPLVLTGTTWTGSYGTGSSAPSSPYRITFLPGGKTVASADGVLTSRADGTFTLTGNASNGTYTYRGGGTFSHAGTVSGATMSGTWGSGSATTGGGTFTLTKETGTALGVWTGKYGNGSTAPNANYRFVVYANGTMDVDIDSSGSFDYHGTGTWTLSGSTFTATYTYPPTNTFSVSCTLSGNSMTNGTWGAGSSASGGGTFNMTR